MCRSVITVLSVLRLDSTRLDQSRKQSSNQTDNPPMPLSTETAYEAHWPFAAPHPEESRFFSVVVGNTSLHWAVHTDHSTGEDSMKGYAPTMYWRLPYEGLGHLDDDDDPVPIFHYFPKSSFNLFWDRDEPPSSLTQLVQHMMTTKRIPAITVYVISTNAEREQYLHELLKSIPARVVVLRQADFLRAHLRSLPYDSIGIDRMAAARAITVPPAIIFDGGTALTTTFVNANGEVTGGTISPGLHALFRSMTEHCHNLPLIEPKQVKELLEELVRETTTISTNTALVTTNTTTGNTTANASTSTENHHPNRTTGSNQNDDLVDTAVGDSSAVMTDSTAITANTSGRTLLSVEAKDTPTAMLVAVLKQVGLFIHSQANYWLQHYYKAPAAGNTTTNQGSSTSNDSMDIPTATGPPTTTNESTSEVMDTSMPSPPSTPIARTVIRTTEEPEKPITLQYRNNEHDLNPAIYITGADANILTTLLDTNLVRKLFTVHEADGLLQDPDVPIVTDSLLIHRGIANVLDQHTDPVQRRHYMEAKYEEETSRRFYLIGQRVAKNFPMHPDVNGDTFFRGVVVRGQFGKTLETDLFMIHYDDGDMEDVDILELHEALLQYYERGEKSTPSYLRMAVEEKRNAAFVAAEKLAEWSPLVKQNSLHRPVANQQDSLMTASRVEEMDKSVTMDVSEAKDSTRKRRRGRSSTGGRSSVGSNGGSTNKIGPKKFEKQVVGSRIAKWFEDTLYYGTVVSHKEPTAKGERHFWFVEYDDGDSEDMDRRDLVAALDLYNERKDEDPALLKDGDTAGGGKAVVEQAHDTALRNDHRLGGETGQPPNEKDETPAVASDAASAKEVSSPMDQASEEEQEFV